jgi:hypothetical protein
MGTKVTYDLCSISNDWDEYRKALSTNDPRVHRHPGVAVLHYHKKIKPIRGLSITRDDYSDYAKYQMNKILPDGRKVFVYNPYPRFFDLSYVFIGAEKTSKMMAKLAANTTGTSKRFFVPQSYDNSMGMEKTASSVEKAVRLLREFKKNAAQKKAEITKEVPSEFVSKAVPMIENSEPSLSDDVLNQMGGCPLGESISTPTMMGITLKPREFQRIVICRLGKSDLADKLDSENKVFRQVPQIDKSIPMEPSFINGLLTNILKNSINERSAFGPVLRRRMVKIVIGGTPENEKEGIEVEDPLLDKISAAYNGYREQVLEKIASMSEQVSGYPEIQAIIYGLDLTDVFGMTKTASSDMGDLLGAVPATYLTTVFARRQMQADLRAGREPDLLTQLYAEFPHLASTIVGLNALKATGAAIPDKVLSNVAETSSAAVK